MNPDFLKIFVDYEEISLRYDVQHRAVWCYYNPTPRPCFTSTMLKELRQMQQSIIDYFNAKQCIDICYLNSVNMHLPLTTISLVEGAALGGGFESALSSNVLIATENSERRLFH